VRLPRLAADGWHTRAQITEAHLTLFERARTSVHRALLPALLRQELVQLRSMVAQCRIFEPMLLCFQVRRPLALHALSVT
jgi:hypothetical protein